MGTDRAPQLERAMGQRRDQGWRHPALRQVLENPMDGSSVLRSQAAVEIEPEMPEKLVLGTGRFEFQSCFGLFDDVEFPFLGKRNLLDPERFTGFEL